MRVVSSDGQGPAGVFEGGGPGHGPRAATPLLGGVDQLFRIAGGKAPALGGGGGEASDPWVEPIEPVGNGNDNLGAGIRPGSGLGAA
jgi:hypothetical protein